MPQLVPRLRAGIRMYRHADQVSGIVHYGGKYATALERKILAGMIQVVDNRPDAYRCTMGLYSGVTLLWDIPNGDSGGRALTFDGALPLRITTFDDHHIFLAEAIFDNQTPGRYALPAGATQVVLTALELFSPDLANQAIGWQSSSLLIQVNPIAFLGGDVVMRPLNPTRIRSGMNSLDYGLVVARNVIAQNWVTIGDQCQRGWVETFVPETTRSIGVMVQPEPPGFHNNVSLRQALSAGSIPTPSAALEQAVSVTLICPLGDKAGPRISSQSLTGPNIFTSASGTYLSYDIPTQPQVPPTAQPMARPTDQQRVRPLTRIRTEPLPGWLLEGIVGWNDAAEHAQPPMMQLSPGLRAASPPAQRPVLTHVELV
jgi:hypothetical protein